MGFNLTLVESLARESFALALHAGSLLGLSESETFFALCDGEEF